ncbi:glycoside hydrolase family 13 protein [Heyndrickxia sporothermodurans]|uniref:Alpha-amylase n=1 Tax=Heyndrickxia sporothermodurans TaxID=46224 RepID=A0AB37H3Z5_9BACI|nr:alpha-glucosidase [Heyndrickxia sporothermodurans]MBL5767827.1 alpha-glucosidase [Heyndrickxia sporothermodurans]MBL5771410.1 alpha-glucosidase [Heyndrickxia sporothermodurans]MBL5775131.1 alpha-glucosidase [Heyndrickxia sporothermodurans]MBL5782078.1 alpha-glucosidase [Heyndrickxia sporothermodurans]MBL5785719.1 alpha-glucosidase [Heyndrickxia sporothermodurans]
MKQTWWKEAIAYQIYPRSFKDSNGDGIGDLNGIISKLDYLKELGIDVIWICPMYKSPNDDNGYDISDYQDIMDEFGTMADFDLLLEEVHKRDMKLIIDLVINHTSDEHPWFIESRSSRNNPKRDWYIWRDGKNGKEPNNWESIFGGSAWKYDEKTDQYFLHIFSTKQPDLNWENKDVRNALYEMINWWLDKGIDGFRVDAISHIKKEEGLQDMPNPKGLQYVPSFDKHMNVKGIQPLLEELKRETFSKYDIMTVGEANGVGIDEADGWVGEDNGKFNMVFQFEHLGLWDAESKTDIDIVELKKVLSRWQKGLENNGWNALFIENHDKARVVSTWGNDGKYWYESATALGAMYFLMQGTPFIYQGQEIGMTNVNYATIDEYDDVATKNLYKIRSEAGIPHEKIMKVIWASSRDNSRTPMQWSDDIHAGFTTGTPWIGVNPNYREINVEKQQKDPHSVYHFYKKMIALKKENKIFTYGTYDLILENDPQIFAYTRTLSNKRVLVLTNLSDQSVKYVHDNILLKYDNLILNNYEVEKHEITNQCLLKPYEARVYWI